MATGHSTQSSNARVVIAPAFSANAKTALVSIRINETEIQATPYEARRIAMELLEMSYRAEEDTVLTDYLIHKAAMADQEARATLAEVRLHRATLSKNRII
jgi:hypothetical protein